MYTMTLAVAAAISGNPHLAVVAAASGVLIGWPFSVLATAPIVIYSLLTGGFVKTVLIGVATCIGILVSIGPL
jgi:alpha-1,2-mannosyltransferase